MKKFLRAMTAVMMAAMLASCGAKMPAPSEAVQAQLDDLKAKSAEEFAKEALNEAGLPEVGDSEKVKDLFSKMMDFDYEVTGEEIAEDKQSATVDVKITTYPFGTAFADLFGNLFSLAVSGDIDVNDEAAVTDYVVQELGSVTEKNYSSTVKIPCTKDGSSWKVSLEDNDEFIDAILGGMYTVMNALNGDAQGDAQAESAGEVQAESAVEVQTESADEAQTASQSVAAGE